MEARIALVTCRQEDAERLARALLERKLAACVNVIPGLRSFYWWEEKISEDAETLLLIKTAEPLVPELEAAIKQLHTYTTPEFIVLAPKDIEERYARWLFAAIKVTPETAGSKA